ncbi:hypothetical protein DJ568_01870 [Mucilaginibacter hurinus]|uniref:Uncharacterized protein n=2 Tax=Mucilaginibacter hurinus TaxID=2201324 RepID=A0A367GT75_9SPHI|nr:hypothetical protein DJ568_01870 [Mucilaginibacter hurinus]
MGTPFYTFKSNIDFYGVKETNRFYLFAENLTADAEQQSIEIRFTYQSDLKMPKVGKFYIYEMYNLEKDMVFEGKTYAEIVDRARTPQQFNTNYDNSTNKSYINFTKVSSTEVSGEFSLQVPAKEKIDGFQPFISVTGKFNNVKLKNTVKYPYNS